MDRDSSTQHDGSSAAEEPALYETGDLSALDFDPFLRDSLRQVPLRQIRLSHGDGTCWLATRYDDVRFVTSDPRFSRDIAGRRLPRMSKHVVPQERAIGVLDPPALTRIRAEVIPAFQRRSVDALRPRAEQIVHALVDGMVADGPPADLLERVISAFPRQLNGELLGVAPEKRVWMTELAQVILTRAEDDEDARAAERAKQALGAHLRGMVRARRDRSDEDERDDLMAHLVRAVDSGRISEPELVGLAALLGVNGWHAVRNNSANMVWLLLTRPPLADRLRAVPDRIPAAVQELLRWIPHKHGLGQARIATEDVSVAGTLVRRGEAVYVSYVAANWDETVFPDAEEIDVDRVGGPAHLAFGYGPHRCPAAALAVMEAEVLLAALLIRLPDLALAVPAGETEWQRKVLIRGPVSLPVTW